jgi:hypothetical protein
LNDERERVRAAQRANDEAEKSRKIAEEQKRQDDANLEKDKKLAGDAAKAAKKAARIQQTKQITRNEPNSSTTMSNAF